MLQDRLLPKGSYKARLLTSEAKREGYEDEWEKFVLCGVVYE